MTKEQLENLIRANGRANVLRDLLRALSTGLPPSKYNRLSKGGKKHASVAFFGSKVKVVNILHAVAGHMPKVVDKETKRPVNHYSNLYARYMNFGIHSVMSYIDTIEYVMAERLKELTNG